MQPLCGMRSNRMEATTMRVKVIKTEVVAPAPPVQEHWLPLSNLDLLSPPVDVGLFFCFSAAMARDDDNSRSNVTVPAAAAFASRVVAMKTSLARVLVPYYAFSGEIVVNPGGEPELLCNNSGVEFTEAYADVELEHLNLHNPDDSVSGKLVPSKRQLGVLAVQATELKCGGMVAACAFDHRIADAYSASMFLISWTEMCRSSSISIIPSFRRSLLCPRHRYGSSHRHCLNKSLDDMYMVIPKLPAPAPPSAGDDGDNGDRMLTGRIYYVPADQLSQLQLLAGSNGCQRTKLESFSAFLWKMVAKSSSASSSSSANSKVKMGILVDGRTRLGSNMITYFGNVLSMPSGENYCSELAAKPLSWVADGVHDFLQAAGNAEHFLGLIDWVEAHRPGPVQPRILCIERTAEEGPAFVVSSGQRFPMEQADFGWGRAVFGSCLDLSPWSGPGAPGYVMLMPSTLDNGDWVVYMKLPRAHLRFIESEAPHIFRPLTFHYLN